MINFFENEMEINMARVHQLKAGSNKHGFASSDPSNHTRMTHKTISVAVATLFLFTTMVSASAGERESLEQLRSTTVNLVNLLVEEGVLSKGKADELLKQASQDAAKAKEKDAVITANTQNESAVDSAVEDKMVRVQYVPEIVKKEMKEEIKKEVMAKLNYKAGERLGLPDWLDRFTFEGDLRLRYQADKFAEGNPLTQDFNVANGGTTLSNTTEDQERARVRARLGVKLKVNDWLNGGIRMTTGGLNDPISPNQTQEAASAKYTVSLDRAYMNAQVTPWLNVVGGRFENPFFSTDLVWDPDLAFDGVAASFTPNINDRWSAFATLGAFPLDEIEGSETNLAKGKWMYGSQAGIKWTSANKSSVKFGVALYEFDNVEGVSNGTQGLDDFPPYDATIPVYRTKGNSVFDINKSTVGSTEKFGILSKFRNLNLTGQLDLATFDPVHITLTGDYARNIGYDKSEILKRIGTAGLTEFGFDKKQVDAYQVRLAVGMPTTFKAHDWQAFVAYKRLEADAVLDAYTDSDFYQSGTNAKGWIIGGSYGLDKNTWLTARWFSADEIKPRVASGDPLSIDVLMLDLNAKF